ncbi:MAG: hypothetical protein R3E70_15645 [Burkholderiaceae bacterium]
MVLLDEPTSGLDDMTERAVLHAVAAWASNKTMLVVTHRPQVLPFVERIIVLQQGRVVLDGPRDAVLHRLSGGRIVPAGAPARGGAAARAQPQVKIVRAVAGATQVLRVSPVQQRASATPERPLDPASPARSDDAA